MKRAYNPYHRRIKTVPGRFRPRGLEGDVFQVDDPCLLSKKAIYGKVDLRGRVEVGDHCRLVGGVVIWGNVKIGKNTSLNGPNMDILSDVYGVEIGNFCSIARNVSIQEHNHIFDRITTYYIHGNVLGKSYLQDLSSKGRIEIGHDVWIGTQCVVLSGSKIGNGAVVAANSVVTGTVPPYAVVAGSPAKIVKSRFPEEIVRQLEAIQWWHWDHDRIKRNAFLFKEKLTADLLSKVIA